MFAFPYFHSFFTPAYFVILSLSLFVSLFPPTLCPLRSIFNLYLILIEFYSVTFLFRSIPPSLPPSLPSFLFFCISESNKVRFNIQNQTKLLVFKVTVNHTQDQTFSPPTLFSPSHILMYFSCQSSYWLKKKNCCKRALSTTDGESHKDKHNQPLFSGFLRSPSLCLSLSP